MKTAVIAHRGYWKKEGSTQNSLSSLRNAADLGVYGSEFDVHLTSDNVPVIHHDPDIAGFAIQKTAYAELKNLVLENGEKIPSLDAYLTAAKELPIRLILEIKPHATPERNREAVRIIIDAVKRHGVTERIDYITFNIDAGKEVSRLQPDRSVAYLGGEYTPAQLKEIGFNGIDFNSGVMEANPGYFEEAKKLGMTVNIWTVNGEENMKRFALAGADFLTSDTPAACRF
ncbi:MAG: hypothetical protein LBG76_09840 [Treponema sp.]|jgi:glycerophosphoryl diester phosphodiesterase|nr:hypothetical protein [Treponema sp.]